jgi:hypothetical protein
MPLVIAAHIWIKYQLHQCIRSGNNWRKPSPIEGEEEILWEMMEVSDRRNSFNEIWTLTARDVSVFYYNLTLATWFFGLNLVRFEFKERCGRSLEII